MYYSKEDLLKLQKGYEKVLPEYSELVLKFIGRSYSNERATEFAHHGFIRRVKTLKRCIDNIFSFCPPNGQEFPERDQIDDVIISLHAFVLNLYGALENLAFVWVSERQICNKKGQLLDDKNVGFSKCVVRDTFSIDFQSYLIGYEAWFKYLEDFRHSLAHRIPLYVPPYAVAPESLAKYSQLQSLADRAISEKDFGKHEALIAELDGLGKFVPWMTHSFGERSRPVVFHAQILADWSTVRDIAENFLLELDGKFKSSAASSPV